MWDLYHMSSTHQWLNVTGNVTWNVTGSAFGHAYSHRAPALAAAATALACDATYLWFGYGEESFLSQVSPFLARTWQNGVVSSLPVSTRALQRFNFKASQLERQELSPYLDAKFKIPNLSHRKRILYTWSIKCRWNEKQIAYFVCKLRDESNEPNYAIIRH